MIVGFGNTYDYCKPKVKGYSKGDKVIVKDNNRFIIADIQVKKGQIIKLKEIEGSFNLAQTVRCTIKTLMKFGLDYSRSEEIVAGQRVVPITLSHKGGKYES